MAKRIKIELNDIRENFVSSKQFRNIEVNETNILNWDALIVPENRPYNKGAFKLEINFPSNQSCIFTHL